MWVYHNFILVPGSRSTFPEVDPDPKHCLLYYVRQKLKEMVGYLDRLFYFEESVHEKAGKSRYFFLKGLSFSRVNTLFQLLRNSLLHKQELPQQPKSIG